MGGAGAGAGAGADPGVGIGPAVPADAGEVLALVRRAYAPYVERIGREPAPMGADYSELIARGSVTVARRGAALVGVLVSEPGENFLLVENIAVAPEEQGTGLGARLLERAEREARELGLGELRLYTNAKMTENLSYYPRRGFVEVERREEDGFDRVFYARALG